MKTQVTAVLLCILLCSTLGHEYQRAKQFVPEARSSNHLSHFRKRSAAPQQCQWICEGGNNSSTNGGLQLIVNETTNLLGIVNVTAEVALVLDINANLVAVFNGTSGIVIVVNIQTGSGIYITANESTSVWLSAHESFEVYFSSLTSLQVFLDLKVGISFTLSSVSTTILQALQSILIHLSVEIGIETQVNIKASLTILIKIASSLSAVLNGSLKGIFQLIGTSVIHLRGDILWLINVFEGLAIFFSKITGGLSALIEAGVQFNFTLLLTATNGIVVFVNLLLAIVVRVDLSVIGVLLNSPEELLYVIFKLGGGVIWGVNGVVAIVYKIIGLINGNIKIDVLIAALLEFAASGSEDIDFSISIKGLLQVVEIQRSHYSSTNLTVFISLVEHLANGTLVIGKVNISEIINILVKGVVNGAIDLVVTVLLLLSVVISPVVVISSLFLELISLLNSTAGIHLLEKVFPGLSINVTVTGGGNIIGEILRGVNIQLIIKLLLSGDITVLLTNLPIISVIYKAVSHAVTVSSKGSFNLKAILLSSEASSIVATIEAIIKGALGISGGISITGNSGEKSFTRSWHWSIKEKHHLNSGHRDNTLREKHLHHH